MNKQTLKLKGTTVTQLKSGKPFKPYVDGTGIANATRIYFNKSKEARQSDIAKQTAHSHKEAVEQTTLVKYVQSEKRQQFFLLVGMTSNAKDENFFVLFNQNGIKLLNRRYAGKLEPCELKAKENARHYIRLRALEPLKAFDMWSTSNQQQYISHSLRQWDSMSRKQLIALEKELENLTNQPSKYLKFEGQR